MTYVATQFTFDLQDGESISDRVARCCHAALDGGPLGKTERHDVYRDFIACNEEDSEAKADALATVATSCALFVRAVRRWCGGPDTGPYKPGTPMFTSMGNVSTSHPAFVKAGGNATPNPGDYFYIASPPSTKKNDGHTGVFIELEPSGTWKTAEGGGGPDGTECRFTERTIQGTKFTNDNRSLWGWFDATKVGLPVSATTSTPSTESSSGDTSSSTDSSNGGTSSPTDSSPEESTWGDSSSTQASSTDTSSADTSSTDASSTDTSSTDTSSTDSSPSASSTSDAGEPQDASSQTDASSEQTETSSSTDDTTSQEADA